MTVRGNNTLRAWGSSIGGISTVTGGRQSVAILEGIHHRGETTVGRRRSLDRRGTIADGRSRGLHRLSGRRGVLGLLRGQGHLLLLHVVHTLLTMVPLSGKHKWQHELTNNVVLGYIIGVLVVLILLND